MSGYLGDFTTSNTVYCLFSTFSSLGASITITGLATSDIKVYKDGGTTQRSSEAGYTLLDTDGIDFDGITGIHGFSIDLSDNTDAGFYAAGHEYLVVVNSITIDAQTVNMVAGTFSIERSGGALALLKHADYGLAKLVRSTTPANTLTVDASHQALALTNAVTNDAITAASIANGAIDAATFAAGAITATVIATGAIDADAIADGAIDNGALAADAISAAKIAADVTTELQSGLATSAELAKVPKSDSNVTWNATALASINAEVDTALNTAIPGSPTADSINERVATMDGRILGTVSAGTHSPQTGDAYAVVNHADYGNAKLVRSTTPANTLTVDASHQALALTNAVTNDAITAAAIANGAIDAATFAAGAIDAAAIADNAIDAGAIADGAIDNGAFAADAISAAKIAADVTTELQAGLATATAALILATPANKLVTDASGYVKVSGVKNTLDSLNDIAAGEAMTLTAAYDAAKTAATQTSVNAIDDYVDAEVAAIKTVTDKLDTALELDGAVYRYTTNALEQAPTGGSAPSVDDIATRLLVTPANKLATDATGNVSLTSAYDAAKTAATQTSVNDLPTNSELATALAGADDAVLAAITGLNDFDPATDVVAHVTLVDTTTTNSDMVAAAPSAADIKTALEADGSKLDHLWEMTEDDGGVRRLTANALEEAPVDGAAPTVGDIADAVWDEALAGHAVAGSAGATLSAATAPSAGDVADAVWNEALAGHAVAGSTGAALSAAGAVGDPWSTALPGAYADGTAGDILGNLVDDIGDIAPTVAISTTTAASVSSGALAIRTHHSLSQAISSTYSGDLSAATKLWLAVKAEKDDTDAQAVIFIEATAGLTVLAGAAYTTVAHGSLTVGGLAGAWTVTVAIDEVATGLLTAYADGMLWAECKALVAGSTVAVWDGVCDVSRGIVVAVA